MPKENWLLGTFTSRSVRLSRIEGKPLNEADKHSVLNAIDMNVRLYRLTFQPASPAVHSKERRLLQDAERHTLEYLRREYGYAKIEYEPPYVLYANPINPGKNGDSLWGVAKLYMFGDLSLPDHAVVQAHELDHTVNTFWEVGENNTLHQYVGLHDIETREGGFLEDSCATWISLRVARHLQERGFFNFAFMDKYDALQQWNNSHENKDARWLRALSSPKEAVEAVMLTKCRDDGESYEVAQAFVNEFIAITRFARAIGYFALKKAKYQMQWVSAELAIETGRKMLQDSRSPLRGYMRDLIYSMFTDAFGEEGRIHADAIWKSDQDPEYTAINTALSAIEAYQGFVLP